MEFQSERLSKLLPGKRLSGTIQFRLVSKSHVSTPYSYLWDDVFLVASANMKKVFLTLCAVFVLIAACGTQKDAARSKVEPSAQKLPFSLSVVPETHYGEQYGSNIVMAHDRPHTFHVVLTNVSNGPQPVWEYWNSWGFQAISFKLTTAWARS